MSHHNYDRARRTVLGANDGAGGGAFTPLAVPDLLAWYDYLEGYAYADTARTTLAAIDGRILGVVDRSGNGYHLSQATSANAPFLKADGAQTNGTGTDTFMTPAGGSIPLGTGDFTAYFAGAISGSGVSWAAAGNEATANPCVIRFGDNNLYLVDGAGGGGNFGAWSPTGAVLLRLRRVSGSLTATGTGGFSATFTVAGSFSFTQTLQRFASQRDSGGGNRHARQLFYTRALTAGEMSSVETYLGFTPF